LHEKLRLEQQNCHNDGMKAQIEIS
jgi:hypothetical protein